MGLDGFDVEVFEPDGDFISSIEATEDTASFRCQCCGEISDLKDAEGEICRQCAEFFTQTMNGEPVFNEFDDTYF